MSICYFRIDVQTSTSVHAEVNKIKEGKQIVDISLKKRGLSTDDIELQKPKKKRYYYKDLTFVK